MEGYHLNGQCCFLLLIRSAKVDQSSQFIRHILICQRRIGNEILLLFFHFQIYQLKFGRLSNCRCNFMYVTKYFVEDELFYDSSYSFSTRFLLSQFPMLLMWKKGRRQNCTFLRDSQFDLQFQGKVILYFSFLNGSVSVFCNSESVL